MVTVMTTGSRSEVLCASGWVGERVNRIHTCIRWIDNRQKRAKKKYKIKSKRRHKISSKLVSQKNM